MLLVEVEYWLCYFGETTHGDCLELQAIYLLIKYVVLEIIPKVFILQCQMMCYLQYPLLSPHHWSILLILFFLFFSLYNLTCATLCSGMHWTDGLALLFANGDWSHMLGSLLLNFLEISIIWIVVSKIVIISMMLNVLLLGSLHFFFNLDFLILSLLPKFNRLPFACFIIKSRLFDIG